MPRRFLCFCDFLLIRYARAKIFATYNRRFLRDLFAKISAQAERLCNQQSTSFKISNFVKVQNSS